MTHRIDNRRLFLVLAVLNLIWAPVNFMVRLATDDGMSPAALAMTRWLLLTGLMFGALCVPWFRERARTQWPRWSEALKPVLIGALMWAPSHLLFYTALGRTSTVEGTVLNTTAPIWTAAMAFVILREHPTKLRLIALVVGFAGAWLVSVGFSLPELSAGHTQGNLMYLVGTISECAAGVLVIRTVRRSSGIATLALQLVGACITYVAAPLLLPALLPFHMGHGWPSVAAEFYLIVLSGFVCFGGWYILVERAPVSLMVVSVLLQPPLAAFIGWRFLGEHLTSQVVVGSILVLAALLCAAAERPSVAAAVGEMPDDEQDEHDAGKDGEAEVPHRA